jgi:hypothetical protein
VMVAARWFLCMCALLRQSAMAPCASLHSPLLRVPRWIEWAACTLSADRRSSQKAWMDGWAKAGAAH